MDTDEVQKELAPTTQTDSGNTIVAFRDKWCAGVGTQSGANVLIRSSHAMSANNLFQRIVYDKSCVDFNSCWNRHGSEIISTCLGVGVGVIFAAITLIIYIFMASCACCRCCRKSSMWCCAKERKQRPSGMGRCTKIFLFSSSFVYMVWYFVDLGITAHNRPSLSTAAKGVFCETSRLLDQTLHGEKGTNNPFMGIVRMESAVQSLQESLEPSASMFTHVDQVVKKSEHVLKNSVAAFVAELTNLHDNLATQSNLMIGRYECVFCEVCCTVSGNTAANTHRGPHSDVHSSHSQDDPRKSRVLNAIDRINEELSESLKEVDEAVEDHISGNKMTDTRKSLSDGQESIVKIRQIFDEKLIKPFVNKDSLLNTIVTILDVLAVVVIAIMVIPTLLLIGTLLWGFWKRRQRNSSSSNSASVEPLLRDNGRRPGDMNMPYPPRKPWFASMGWCITFLFAFLIFVLGGVASIIAYAETSACESIVKPKELMSKLAFRFEKKENSIGDQNDEEENPLIKLSNSCLAHNADGSFLDVVDLKIQDEEEEEEEEEVEEQQEGGDEGEEEEEGKSREAAAVKDGADEEIEEEEDDAEEPNQIKKIEKRMYRDIRKMEKAVGKKHKMFSKNKDVLDFLNYLEHYGDLYLMKDHDDSFDNRVAAAALVALFPSAPLMTQAEFENIIATASTGTASCERSESIPLKGPVGRFIRQRFEDLGYDIANATSITFPGTDDYYDLLQRHRTIDVGVRRATAGGNPQCPAKYENLQPVSGPVNVFFQELLEEKLAVINKSDFICNRFDRETNTHIEKRCTHEEWREYLAETHTRLTELAEMVDKAQSDFSSKIAAEVRDAFETNVVPRMDVLAGGMSCKYIHDRYNELANHLCMVHAPAMRATAVGWMMFASMCWIAIMVEFWIWRYLKDFWTLTNDENDDGGDFHTPPEDPLDTTLILSGGDTPPLRETRWGTTQ